jgi:hypothetical protein
LLFFFLSLVFVVLVMRTQDFMLSRQVLYHQSTSIHILPFILRLQWVGTVEQWNRAVAAVHLMWGRLGWAVGDGEQLPVPVTLKSGVDAFTVHPWRSQGHQTFLLLDELWSHKLI